MMVDGESVLYLQSTVRGCFFEKGHMVEWVLR
jgi:hypothetical protein